MIDTVEKGQTASFHYRGTLDDGEEFDNSRTRGPRVPMETQVGSDKLIKGFDDALVGMRIGEVKSVSLGPNEAYGTPDPSAVTEIRKDLFPPDFVFEKGRAVRGTHPSGKPIFAVVLEEKETTVSLDYNHPLAGKNLNFEIELIGIQE